MTKRSHPKGFVRRNVATIKAVAIFLVSLAVFFWILNNDWMLANIFGPFTQIVAHVTVFVFTVVGMDATATGKTVSVSGTTLSIATGCNGVEAMALYFSAVLALPTRWRRRLLGIAIGIVGIFIINQVRVVGLFLVAMLHPEVLPQAHHYAGQTFVIVMGMALWFFWAEHYADFRPAKGRAAAS